MVNLLKKIVKKTAWDFNKFHGLYLRICKPRNDEYAEYLKRRNYFYAQGEHCTINLDAAVTDPKYVRLGNNICISSCTLIGHDGSIAVLNRAYNKKLESVGKIDIKDNVFIGYGAIILPGVTIGPNAIVAAGAVVSKDVAEGTIVGGIPAKNIGHVETLVEKLETNTAKLPWAELIQNREGGFDPEIEPELVRQRLKYFYPDD